MKKILFVINTMGHGGAETALIALLHNLDPAEYDVSLYVMMGQGEMIGQVPVNIHVLNPVYHESSVLSPQGRKLMFRTVFRAFFRSWSGFWRNVGYVLQNLAAMLGRERIQKDKLLWRVLSDGSPQFPENYDLAVAYLEGGATYYVADHVHARRKASFVHIDYESAGYTRKMDRDCFQKMDRIFAVSDETRTHFLNVYPEYSGKTDVLHNLVDQDQIRKRATEPGGFDDGYSGIRLLTVGRLTYQKAYDIAIDALKLIRDRGYEARWYVLGEGEQRKELEKKAASLGLKNDFVLLGASENPFPYYAQADIYVHATRYEGKSIAIQEAQTLGCAIIASDCNGNREQIRQGVDGLLCPLEPQAIADFVTELIEDPGKRKELGWAASQKLTGSDIELQKLFNVMES